MFSDCSFIPVSGLLSLKLLLSSPRERHTNELIPFEIELSMLAETRVDHTEAVRGAGFDVG